jgi:hypothetical protein
MEVVLPQSEEFARSKIPLLFWIALDMYFRIVYVTIKLGIGDWGFIPKR